MDPHKPLILRWTWRHFSLDVDIEESIEDAARSAWSESEYETGALECVEVIEPDGTTRRLNDAELDAYRPAPAPASERPPMVAEVRILSPEQEAWNGRREWRVWDVYPSLASAEEAAAELQPWLGDRVTAKVIGA